MDQATFNRMANAWLESRADLGPANDSQEGRDAREWAEPGRIFSWAISRDASNTKACAPGSRR